MLEQREVIGVIPAAGRGRRIAGLRWLKELYPLGDQEVLVDGVVCRRPKVASEYLIESIVAAGASRLVFILGDGKHDIMHYYGGGERLGVPIGYVYQDELRGVPYALDLARPWLPPAHTVLYGMPDTIVDQPDCFQSLLVAHQASAAALTLGLFQTEKPSKFGMVRLVGDRPVELIDKPAETDLTWMWGIACWSEVFSAFVGDYLRERPFTGREIVPTDVFAAAIAAGLRVEAVPFADARYIDIGTPEDLNLAVAHYGRDGRVS